MKGLIIALSLIFASGLVYSADFTAMTRETYIAYGLQKGWIKESQTVNNNPFSPFFHFSGYEILCPIRQCTITEIDENIDFIKWYVIMGDAWFFGTGSDNEYPDGAVYTSNGDIVVEFYSREDATRSMLSFAKFLGNLLSENTSGDSGIIFGRAIQQANLKNIEVVAWKKLSMFQTIHISCRLGLKE